MVFDRLLAALHTHGGSVVFFSGDAVTCWIDGDDGRLAVACGLAMKVTVAVGSTRRFVVGDDRGCS